MLIDGVATLAFAATATWPTGQAIDAAVVASGRGAGQWLSAAPVALLVAGVFAGRLLRDPGLRPLTIRRDRGVA